MKLKFTDLEKATISDALGDRDNILNKEFAAIRNYFKQNNTATTEYTLECLEVIGELITIAEARIKLIRSLPRYPEAQKDIKIAKTNLQAYRGAYASLIKPIAGVYTGTNEQN